MGILQAPQQIAGTVGINPNLKFMVTTDSLATLTTAGYLNNIDLMVYPIRPNDVLQVLYSYNTSTNSGTYGVFTPSISNGVISLNVSYPSGLGTAAQKAATNNSLANVASASGTFVANDVVVAGDTAGTVKDGGYFLHATFANFAGGSTTLVITDAKVTASSIVFAEIYASTNAVAIARVAPGSGNITVTFTADPGAATIVNYLMISAAV